MNASLLVLGNIPKGTECPFRDKCGFAKDDTCNHRGKDHPCDYSCAAARAFDISHQYQEAKPCGSGTQNR